MACYKGDYVQVPNSNLPQDFLVDRHDVLLNRKSTLRGQYTAIYASRLIFGCVPACRSFPLPFLVESLTRVETNAHDYPPPSSTSALFKILVVQCRIIISPSSYIRGRRLQCPTESFSNTCPSIKAKRPRNNISSNFLRSKKNKIKRLHFSFS